MKQNWVSVVLRGQTGVFGLLVVAAYGMFAWRHRQNKFLFFGWAGVAVAYCLLYAMFLVHSFSW
jgi:hypothetical protein